jgi:uncharacterized membrane protein
MKIITSVWKYLKDWKNLLTHGIIGIAILAAALFIPVAPVYRVLILVVVIAVNLIRMNYSKKVRANESDK